MSEQNKVTGVVLAGGLARRMQQQDKGLVTYKKQPMISYALKAIVSVVDDVIINANRNKEQYQKFGFQVISDQTNTFDGPLAGVLAAMSATSSDILLVMPCDSPLVKPEHLHKLLNNRMLNDADIAVAFDGERLHPVFLALKTSLRMSLQDYLQKGERKIDRWLQLHHMVTVDFSDEPEVFMNINTLTDLEDLQEQRNE